MPDAALPADNAAVRSVLAALTAISPFFEVDVETAAAGDTATAVGDTAGSVVVEEFHRGGDALATAIAGVSERLGGVEARVAASTLSLGHAARLWSVTLGSWATAGMVPDLDPAALRVRPWPGAPIRLIVDRPAGWWPAPRSPGDPPGAAHADAAALIHAMVIERNLRPYFAAVRAHTGLARGLLWGNAASALVGAANILTRHLTSPSSPSSPSSAPGPSAPGAGAVGPRAVGGVVAWLLTVAPLAGTTTHTVGADGQLTLASVVRRSCCLFYRVPGGGTCGDCPLGRKRDPGRAGT